ncbi:hypothetical protein LEP1GSC034_1045 [Leptospira interrogans str. 2003000735]|nr:hypothetical protein LEP1GSC027_3998 [Leptospira interrogans str. 2002000624]EKQ40360.1 hypothetical protein LEP1GSC025_2192 [Leptospira interrogans str. 2002000621]EMJ70835.1 hypothetical protein LEP1GSC034_1045 [Leptospira interrogans str. 2003000735]EMJ72791.1 hypothetical protein LEP1GSC033_1494 [Leptospira interrogans str. 2002000632]EMJ78568.1 hypothetical protein LEP1GSC032_0547 [Leptospira interrogans str. 2002000631]
MKEFCGRFLRFRNAFSYYFFLIFSNSSSFVFNILSIIGRKTF